MVDFKACVFDGVKFKLDRVSVKGSCRLTDTGTNFTCYFTHPHLMFYFACYATPRSLHKLYGSMFCSAYNSSTSNKAQYTICVNPMMIGHSSVVEGDDERSATEYEFGINDLKESLKIKFLIYLFMMQHWGDEKQVDYITLDYEGGNKQLFGQELLKIKRELVALGLHAVDVEPIVGVYLEIRRSSGTSRRPGCMVRQDVDYEANPLIKPLDFKGLMANKDICDGSKALVLDMLQPAGPTGSAEKKHKSTE